MLSFAWGYLVLRINMNNDVVISKGKVGARCGLEADLRGNRSRALEWGSGSGST